MTNEQLIKKMKEDMKMRNFSKYTYDSYLGKTNDIMRYYGEKKLWIGYNKLDKKDKDMLK